MKIFSIRGAAALVFVLVAVPAFADDGAPLSGSGGAYEGSQSEKSIAEEGLGQPVGSGDVTVDGMMDDQLLDAGNEEQAREAKGYRGDAAFEQMKDAAEQP